MSEMNESPKVRLTAEGLDVSIGIESEVDLEKVQRILKSWAKSIEIRKAISDQSKWEAILIKHKDDFNSHRSRASLSLEEKNHTNERPKRTKKEEVK